MFRQAKLRGPIGRIYPLFFISAHVLAIGEFLLRNELIQDGMQINQGPNEVSYVLFSKDGNIIVHIAAFDYKQYTKRFTFDQLCNSLGNTFQRFLKYYQEGHEERIINELKSV